MLLSMIAIRVFIFFILFTSSGLIAQKNIFIDSLQQKLKAGDTITLNYQSDEIKTWLKKPIKDSVTYSALEISIAKKENVDAQLKMQADLQNAQLEAQNRGTKFAIDDWNAKSKEAKRKYLEKAIEQMGTLSQNAQAMDVQEKYMRLLSPQYGKTFEYQTIFDQLKDYYKNKKSSKENKA